MFMKRNTCVCGQLDTLLPWNRCCFQCFLLKTTVGKVLGVYPVAGLEVVLWRISWRRQYSFQSGQLRGRLKDLYSRSTKGNLNCLNFQKHYINRIILFKSVPVHLVPCAIKRASFSRRQIFVAAFTMMTCYSLFINQ